MNKTILFGVAFLTSLASLPIYAQDSKKDTDDKGGVTRLPGINIHVKEKRLVINGFICRQRSSQLEVLACTTRGKTHESLLLIDCGAEHLQLGLILLGLKPSPQVKSFGEVKALKGQKVVLEVEWSEGEKLMRCGGCFKGACKLHKDPMSCNNCQEIRKKEEGGWCENCQQGWRWERPVLCRKCWLRTCEGHFSRECKDCKAFEKGERKTHCLGAIEHGDLDCKACLAAQVKGQGWCDKCEHGYKGGKIVRQRVEKLIFDRYTGSSMVRAGWIFTGSRQIEVPIPPEFEKKKKVFAAKHIGNIGALFHDPDAILDTPLLKGGDDTAFLPYSKRLPRRMTPIRIHVRPWSKADQALFEKDLAKAPKEKRAPDKPGKAPKKEEPKKEPKDE